METILRWLINCVEYICDVFLCQVKETTDPEVSTAPFSFTVAVESRCLVLVANSQEEKDKWLEDLRMVCENARECGEKEAAKILYPSLKSNS